MIPDREGKAGEKATTETGRKADRELSMAQTERSLASYLAS